MPKTLSKGCFTNCCKAFLKMHIHGSDVTFHCEVSICGGCLQRVLQILLNECSGRLHWGKAGWPRYNACFDGSAHFPDWCSFGCAVQVRAPYVRCIFVYSYKALCKYLVQLCQHCALGSMMGVWCSRPCRHSQAKVKSSVIIMTHSLTCQQTWKIPGSCCCVHRAV